MCAIRFFQTCPLYSYEYLSTWNCLHQWFKLRKWFLLMNLWVARAIWLGFTLDGARKLFLVIAMGIGLFLSQAPFWKKVSRIEQSVGYYLLASIISNTYIYIFVQPLYDFHFIQLQRLVVHLGKSLQAYIKNTLPILIPSHSYMIFRAAPPLICAWANHKFYL